MLRYGSHLLLWQVALMSLRMIIFWGLLIWGLYVLIIGSSRHSSQIFMWRRSPEFGPATHPWRNRSRSVPSAKRSAWI